MSEELAPEPCRCCVCQGKECLAPHEGHYHGDLIESQPTPTVAKIAEEENERLVKLVKVLQDWGCAGRQYTHVDNVTKLQAELEQAKQKIAELEEEITEGWMESNEAGGKIITDLRACLATAEAALSEARTVITKCLQTIAASTKCVMRSN